MFPNLPQVVLQDLSSKIPKKRFLNFKVEEGGKGVFIAFLVKKMRFKGRK